MEILLKIKDFSSLQQGWCYGEGIKFSKEILNKAERLAILFISHGFSVLDAFPGLDGEVRITAYVNEYYFEFTLEIDDTITFVCEQGDQEVEYIENINFKDCSTIIKRFSHLCNLYELFIKSTSTKTEGNSKVLRSNPPRLKEMGSQYSAKSVHWKPAEKCVNIYKTTIMKLADPLQFFGSSTAPFYQIHIPLKKYPARQMTNAIGM